MKPVRVKETNFTYLGPTPAIGVLPCSIEGSTTFSCWSLTDDECLQLAAGAHVRLGVVGAVLVPPVVLHVVPDAGDFGRVPNGMEMVAKERMRHIAVSYDAAHDDTHADGSLAELAILVAGGAVDGPACWVEDYAKHLHAKYERDEVSKLVIATALLVAEIERLQRTSSPQLPEDAHVYDGTEMGRRATENSARGEE